MLSQFYLKALSSTLEDKNFKQINKKIQRWKNGPLIARLIEDRFVMYHVSGYTFIDEVLSNDDIGDRVLSIIEKNELTLPTEASLSALAGLTDPKFFISNIGEYKTQTQRVWAATAKALQFSYKWRTASKKFELKIRGKATFKVSKGGKVGYRENAQGHLFVIKVDGTREYRTAKSSLKLINDNTKAHKGRAPKLINITDDKPKKAVKKKPKTTAKSKSDVMSYLKKRYGKGWTARKIKADLKNFISLSEWPTRKLDLMKAVDSAFSIEELMNSVYYGEQIKDKISKLTKAKKELFDKLKNDPTTLRTTLLRLNLPYPKGNTTDLGFWDKVALEVLDNASVKEINNTFKKVVPKPSAHIKLAPITAVNPVETISFEKRKHPAEYNLRSDSKGGDKDTTKALKLFIQELYKFAGSDIRPTMVQTKDAFRDGIASVEYLRVSTTPNSVTEFSAESFYNLLINKMKSNKLFKIVKIERHLHKDRIGEEVTLKIESKKRDLPDIRLNIRINPRHLSGTFNKHNVFMNKAKFLKDKGYTLQQTNFNLTIYVNQKEN